MEVPVFTSLAHLRVLLLPVGQIERPVYEHWAKEISSFQSIRLGDVPPDSHDERARFMPSPLASGYLHLNYTSHPPPPAHQHLSLFRPSALPLGVIGVATCSNADAMSTILHDFNTSLARLFPPGSTFPLASNCFVFEESDGTTSLDVKDRFPGLIIIPGMMGNKTLYVGTLIADLCSQILGEFSVLMQSLESPLGNEYLNASLFPLLPPASELPPSLDAESHTHASLPPLPSQSSQPELVSGIPARMKSPIGLRRASTGPNLSPQRHNSLPTPAAKKRPSTIGAVSSHGRLFKVLGDLFLLAGRLEDATVWYGEAIALFKPVQDSAWHASALEGMATISILGAWASNETTKEHGDSKEPWSDTSLKLSQAIDLYFRYTPQSDHEGDYPLLSYLYCQAVFRHASLLHAVWLTKSWGPSTFSKLVYGDLGVTSEESDHPARVEVRRSKVSLDLQRTKPGTIDIPLGELLEVLAQVHGPWLLHLGPGDRISILQELSSFYGALGFLRKEAFVLREVLGCIMDLVVCGREEVGNSTSTRPGLGMMIGKPTVEQGTVGVKLIESARGNESILRIVKHVCRVHGVDLEAVKLVDKDSPSRRRDSVQSVHTENADVSSNLEETRDFLEDPYGWPELQIGIVREAIAVAEGLPDYPSVAQFALSSLRTLYAVMSASDQNHLYRTATRALATAARRGDGRTVNYWAGQPIVSMELLRLPLLRLPMEKPMSLLSAGEPSVKALLTGAKDPFLYNPRRATGGKNSSVLVQNEPFEVQVTLRNPFVFDLELQSLALSTSGAKIESKAIPMVIPANSYHPVKLSCKALEAGLLTVRGCIVQAHGGVPREFVLPLATDEEEDRRSSRRSTIGCEVGRSKYTGLQSRPWAREKRASLNSGSKASAQLLECQVVPEQPLLRIRRTSLAHGAVMLYSGESSAIHITLENVSNLPIDLLHLTFDDSTVGPAQEALAEGELSVFDAYETEYELVRKPALTWDSDNHSQSIEPGDKTIITVRCFGKVDCTRGSVNIAYAYVHRDDTRSDVFYTRQLTYPVIFTVYHMLECYSMDITNAVPSPSLIDQSVEDSLAARARSALADIDDIDDWCLFSIEVRNTYGLPFEVTLERTQEGAPASSVSCLVPPGSTSRLVIPIKKFLLPEEHISRPIPSLADRQFVVAKETMTSSAERIQKALFWYREALLEIVQGRWRESGGTRSGELSLRHQRLSLPMLETLRTEPTRVKMSLLRSEGAEESPTTGLTCEHRVWKIDPFTFHSLRTEVINLSASPLILTMNVILQPPEHIIAQGVLKDIPIGRLQDGQSREVQIPIAFVSCGRFEMTAEVCAFSGSAAPEPVGQGKLIASVTSEEL